ncbi:MAG: AraC family transcriptional regulator [Spirochaetes bacterium]|nr:AraC family transcriptional regulator [Spirochaetota bacterium]MBN2771613.1 AraC family transcriptional regulator [Spirochaetota bacterium]
MGIESYFVLFTVGLGLLMAAALYVRPVSLRSVTLSIIFISFSGMQFSSVMFYTRLVYQIPGIIYISPALVALIPVALYLYTQTFTCERKRIFVSDFPHFIPFLIIAIISLFEFISPLETKLQHIDKLYTDYSPFSILVVLNMVYLIVYFILCIISLHKVYLKENIVHKRIMRIFMFFLSIIVLSILKVVGLVFSSVLNNGLDFMMTATVIFSVYLIHFFFLSQRFPVLLAYGSLAPSRNSLFAGKVDNSKRTRTTLDAINIEHTAKEIVMLMEEEKIYCDEDLTLKRLSRAMNITPHQLSAFLNDHYGKNFNTFINSYRIKHACELLKDPSVSTLSAAFASGFNSYTAFYTAFKKHTGKSPGNYKTLSK